MSKKTNNDITRQTTKQMLDELDALMDKMLSLPVNDPDEAPPFPQEAVKPPTLSATLTLLQPPAAAPAPPHPALNPPHFAPGSALPEPLPTVHEPAPQPETLTNQVVPSSVLPDLQPLLEEIPDPAIPVTTQWGYLPLLWINQGFDRLTAFLLGPAEALLRTRAGRALLGVSGVALLVVAAVWFLKDWLGWN